MSGAQLSKEERAAGGKALAKEIGMLENSVWLEHGQRGRQAGPWGDFWAGTAGPSLAHICSLAQGAPGSIISQSKKYDFTFILMHIYYIKQKQKLSQNSP